MNDQTIPCTNCGARIPLSAAIAEYASAELKKKEAAFKADFEKRLNEEAKARAKKLAKELNDVEMEDLRSQLKEASDRAELAKQQELKLRKQVREVEQQKQDLDLEVQRQVEEQVQLANEANAKRIAEEHTRQIAEKEKKITDLHQKLVEMERRIAQGSQQTQGEVAELALEKVLAALFPQDEFKPIAKGRNGADVLQIVKTGSGNVCGRILFERKQTQAWEEKWTAKLKDDQLEASAELGVIVTAAFPKGESRRLFQRGGVWVTDANTAPGLALALRAMLLELHGVRQAAVDEHDKRAIVYRYLTGTQFKQRVEAIVEAFTSMRADIESEKAAIQRLWNKREKQLERVIKNTVGMWGDLQGIAGANLPKIKALELPGPRQEK